MESGNAATTSGKLELGRNMTVLFTLPFWLSDATRPCHAQAAGRKTEAFGELAEAMSAEVGSSTPDNFPSDKEVERKQPAIVFEAVNLTEQGVSFPDGLARRKGALIVSSDLVGALDDLTGGAAKIFSDRNLTLSAQACRIIYYDYGAGYFEYRLDVRLSESGELETFGAAFEHLVEKVVLPYQENGASKLNEILARVSRAIGRDNLTKISSFKNWLLAEQNTSNLLTWAFCASILSFVENEEDILPVDSAEAYAIRNHITEGHERDDQDFFRQRFPGLFELYATHGDTGSFIVARSLGDKHERAANRERVFNLLGFGWMNSCLLIESIEATYTKEIVYFGDQISARRLIDNTQLIRRARDLLQVMTFEVRSIAVCSLSLDYHLYDGIFLAAEMQNSIDFVDRAVAKFDSLVEEIKIYEAIRIRVMLRSAAVVGGMLGIVATLVGILSYVDAIDRTAINEKIGMLYNVRATMVYILVGFASVVMLIFIFYTEKLIVYSRFWKDEWGFGALMRGLFRKRGGRARDG